MRNLSKVTALALLMSLSGVAFTAPALAAPDYAKIEARKKAKEEGMWIREAANAYAEKRAQRNKKAS